MPSVKTETETVIKKILPYLSRRGYDVEKDIDFETAITTTDRPSKGFVDLLVTCGRVAPMFLIEAKKVSKTLSAKDRDQAISYAKAMKVPFAVVTNGKDIRCYNTKNKELIRWNGSLSERIPTKDQLPLVLRTLQTSEEAVDIPLTNDTSLPFRPGLPIKQLNTLFTRCHNAIRNKEKDEEHAFADFSKLLFLKLLEEKSDTSDFKLPYSYRFHELAKKPEQENDQVKGAVLQMIQAIKNQTTYGDVLEDNIYLKVPGTYGYIIKQLAAVSFYDSSLDSKGAAFEYFVRATLKGKKLGQYFTPRALIQLMLNLVGREKIFSSVCAGSDYKVLDPACGTGGFLVFMMQENLRLAEERYKARGISKTTLDTVSQKLMGKVFFGADANPGVACAAKMNMIIIGDGHTNIRAGNSLSKSASNWSMTVPDCDLIMTNPPFGTSETEALSAAELSDYPLKGAKGQQLFLQKMVLSTKPGGEICTVIDEGILNTDSALELRKWLLQKCRLIAVVRLPEETFKPNKINVRSSVLYLQRLEQNDPDLDGNYPVTFCDIGSLGYVGSGDKMRSFDFDRLLNEVSVRMLDTAGGTERSGYGWSSYDLNVRDIAASSSLRFDWKYWESSVYNRVSALKAAAVPTINDLSLRPASRGISPPADVYVDKEDGYALVVKAGSNISRYGELLPEGDYVEKSLYDEYVGGDSRCIVANGDVLLASTGEGTLGKCCVYRLEEPAIADGHVTIIRVDQERVFPEYLCDYLRSGFGGEQINRLYTGSTGLIELTASDVGDVLIGALPDVEQQKLLSKGLRDEEKEFTKSTDEVNAKLAAARLSFLSLTSSKI